MTEEEKAVNARLAASNVVSLKDPHGHASNDGSAFNQEKADALSRLRSAAGLSNESPEKLEEIFARMITYLENSDLTINFDAARFFTAKPKGIEFTNGFVRGNMPDQYKDRRNTAEENLFDYSNSRGNSSNPEIRNTIQNLGSNDSPDFEPSIRPKYGTLNYAKLRGGGTEGKRYGDSHMVLKDHLKGNCTFLDRDSFDNIAENNPDKVANYTNLQRLFLHMTPGKLKAIYNLAMGNDKERGTDLSYIEAQIHTSIFFNRDIKKVVIAGSESGGLDDSMKKNIRKVAQRCSIELSGI